MFNKDLTPYEYLYTGEEFPRPLNVGWLDTVSTFDVGETTDDFKMRLFLLCKTRIEECRGVHECPFCACSDQITETRDGITLQLGSAEIRATGVDGTVYAAPNLIYHYVAKHGYKPPEGFIRAVCHN